DDVVEDPARARPDPTPRIPHPVTGELVPDPDAKLPYYDYRGARQAPWPHADFIVGNPPYMGRWRQREEFGDGYVDALRAAYPEVPEDADYVMYWWYRAAREVAGGRTIRAGMITTNTIRQKQQRGIIERAADHGARICWAIPDHPWVDETGSAAVRVSMTVIARDPERATLIRVDDQARVTAEVRVSRLNADLTAHADIPKAAAEALLANRGLASNGFNVVGRGFVLEADEAQRLLDAEPRHAEVVRPYLNGRDLAARPRGVWIIDFALRTEGEARQYPLPFDLVRSRVQPERAANARQRYRTYWWQFGETRSGWRAASAGLARYIATPYVSKHRFFTFLDAEVAPDDALRVIASPDAFHLGVLSSRIHVTWALAAGGRLGVGNDPRYNQTLCFNPFPFPAPPPELRQRIAEAAERLDRHRKEALERDERVTMTGMYNVVEKLRSGEPLTEKERAVHE